MKPLQYSHMLLSGFHHLTKLNWEILLNLTLITSGRENVHSYTDLKPFLVCHLSLATKQRVIFIIMKGRAATITRRIQACAAKKKRVINFLNIQFHGNLSEQ